MDLTNKDLNASKDSKSRGTAWARNSRSSDNDDNSSDTKGHMVDYVKNCQYLRRRNVMETQKW